MKNQELLAKLLASENIDIIQAPVRTALFDIESRVLTIPQWQDMSPQIELMLLAHEVSHALFTPMELCLTDSSPMVYRNVIEDVRVERKIQKMFPGLRKDFIQGYKELNESDFFGIKDADLSKMNLIDRINIYFKAGISSGIKFSKEEMVYVDRAKICDTYNDVIELSSEIYQFMKDDYLANKDEESTTFTDIEEDDEEVYEDDYEDYGLYDEESEAEKADGESNGEAQDEPEENEAEGNGEGGSKKESEDSKEDTSQSNIDLENSYSTIEDKKMEEALESTTQDKFDSRLDNLADVDTVIVNHTTDIDKKVANPIIPYKDIMAELVSSAKDNYQQDQTASIQKWKDGSNRYVNYLVKEFEMKKSASRYARTVTAKSGSLNDQKLYAHKLTDDMFKSITTVSDDKNHGMVFLLDWSGSMSNVMEDTLKQVINLAMFCKRSSIKFQVLAFTSGYYVTGKNCSYTNKSISSGDFKLLELFSSKMSTSEFTKMTNMLLTRPWHYNRLFRLNYTPLNSALLYMVDYLGDFIRSNNIQKASLVTLSDGGSDLLRVESNSDYRSRVIHKIWDTKKKKSYFFPSDSLGQTKLLINIIKDRYNIPVLGFFIGNTQRRGILTFINCNVGTFTLNLFEEIKTSLRKENVFVYRYSAYDELYFIPDSKAPVDEELAVTDKMSNGAAAKSFGKFLNQGKSSQVVLNRFIAQIC